MRERYQKFVSEELPVHLRPFVATQSPELYTPIDHASWRFIIRISKAFFKEHGHEIYLNGLEATGILTDRIPLVEEMDAKLSQFGWRAVAVSGFIPSAAFLEFQAMKILPIACEMRTLEHLAYTPAPDIVHEAAGHAPIVADPVYREYLLQYGEIARKAIFSIQDQELFEAIRALSDIKEDPASTEIQIDECQKHLDNVIASVTYTSEATVLSRMAWWTTEYGLFGSCESPKIFGAGLLSSVGESFNCLSSKVKKIPMTLDCTQVSFDITKPQPQLFVTPSFDHLKKVLEEFASTMAFRKGGFDGLSKAKIAQTVTSTVLDTGIQISGVLAEFFHDEKTNPVFLKLNSATQLAFEDHEIENQGPEYHKEGFSTPIGLIRGTQKNAGELTDSEISKMGGELVFESGIVLTGTLKNRIVKNGKTVILQFENCHIVWGEKTLYRPEWGIFDLACGSKVVSVFGGAADRANYLEKTGQIKKYPQKEKTNLTPENRELNELYAVLRALRESSESPEVKLEELTTLQAELENKFPKDWLLGLEILEICSVLKCGDEVEWKHKLHKRLIQISKSSKEVSDLITRGLEIL